ncbi:MAG TPA: pyridoxal-dependent decarboxylase, partial [Minicystis sp.]|nr:pyridoxal-dependent decarboxylase [Minicystis sp.]
AAAVADLVALSTNRYVGIGQAAPALVELEANAVRWCAEMLGMPEGALGVLTTGGSLSNLVAVVTARRERLGDDLARGVVYVSDQAHHSVRKACAIAGISRVRTLPSDAGLRLAPDEVARAVGEDRAAGLSPFLLVASAGTTNTGAVDPLGPLADVAAAHELFFHVDAAYGGFFALTARGRAALAGIDRADTVTLDPHKSLFLPYGTGCLVARDPEALRRAHAMTADYLPPPQDEQDLVDFADLGPELSREARGLRLWLPLKLHGAAAFRVALDEKLDLARAAADAIAALPSARVVAPPALSLFAFRVEPPGVAPEAADALNRAVLAGINARRRVFLTGAVVRGRFVIRVCVLSFRTHADRIDALVEDAGAAIDAARA